MFKIKTTIKLKITIKLNLIQCACVRVSIGFAIYERTAERSDRGKAEICRPSAVAL